MLFALWGLGLFLDWVCCIGRKLLVRGKRNPPQVPTISKQCGVSGWAPRFWQKVGLNFELFD